MPEFGPAYVEALDGKRLSTQMITIRDYMLAVQWRTLREISLHLGYPEGSVSAQLRHLKKERFGHYKVEKRRRDGRGTWEYHVDRPSREGRLF